MSFTAFGGLFLPLALFVFLLRRAWLAPLLCVAAVLHSPSVANLRVGAGWYGITPFVVVAGLVALDLLLALRHERRLSFGQTPEQRRVVPWWLAFGAISLLGALLLPSIFQGTAVFVPLNKEGAHAELAPLAFSLSNVAQVLNVTLLMAALLWVARQPEPSAVARRMLVGMILAVALSALIGLQQRLAMNGLLPLWDAFWASNPSYSQNFENYAGPVPRVSWPFVEASYGSAWYATVLGGFVAMFFAGWHRHLALLGATASGFALANSMGATGALASVLYLGCVLGVVAACFVRYPKLREDLLYRLALAALVVACLLLGGYLTLRHYHLVEVAKLGFENLLQGRSQTVLGDLRPHADRHALQLMLDTWGLGVGMGSNRASSYLAALAGATGVVGLLLFLVAFARQFDGTVRNLRADPYTPTVFFAGSTLAGFLAVAIAIPDQNWPVFWVQILGGVACLGAAREQRDEAAEPN
jgi:hypothetical protein